MDKQSNVLDYPKPGLDPAIWTEEEKLRPEVKDAIFKVLEEVLAPVQDLIIHIKLIGSLTSWQWNSRSDLDIHVTLNWDELKKKQKGMSDEELEDWLKKSFIEPARSKHYVAPNTQHPIEVAVESPNKESSHPDGIYDVLADGWSQPARKVEQDMDPQAFFGKLIEFAESKVSDLDTAIGKARRDIKNIEALQETIQAMPEAVKRVFRDRLEERLAELEEEIITLVNSGKEVSQARDVDYDPNNKENVTFKYLQKFGYIWLCKQLEKIVGNPDEGEQKLEEIDLQQVKEVLDEGTENLEDKRGTAVITYLGKGTPIEGRPEWLEVQAALDDVILETAIEDYADDSDESFYERPEYNEIKSITSLEELKTRFPAIAQRYEAYYNAHQTLPPNEDPDKVEEFLRERIEPLPSAQHTINELPVLDKGQAIDNLLEQLSQTSDPTLKQEIERKIDRVKQSSIHREDLTVEAKKSFEPNKIYTLKKDLKVYPKELGQEAQTLEKGTKVRFLGGMGKYFKAIALVGGKSYYRARPSALKEALASLIQADNKIMLHCTTCNKTFYTSPDSGIDQCPDCSKKQVTSAQKCAVKNCDKEATHSISINEQIKKVCQRHFRNHLNFTLKGPWKTASIERSADEDPASALKRLQEYKEHNPTMSPEEARNVEMAIDDATFLLKQQQAPQPMEKVTPAQEQSPEQPAKKDQEAQNPHEEHEKTSQPGNQPQYYQGKHGDWASYIESAAEDALPDLVTDYLQMQPDLYKLEITPTFIDEDEGIVVGDVHVRLINKQTGEPDAEMRLTVSGTATGGFTWEPEGKEGWRDLEDVDIAIEDFKKWASGTYPIVKIPDNVQRGRIFNHRDGGMELEVFERQAQPSFGSVEWQQMMEKRVKEKIQKGLPLDDAEKAFVEIQSEHNKRMMPQGKQAALPESSVDPAAPGENVDQNTSIDDKILSVLQDGSDKTAYDISCECNIPWTTVTKTLNKLKAAGLVDVSTSTRPWRYMLDKNQKPEQDRSNYFKNQDSDSKEDKEPSKAQKTLQNAEQATLNQQSKEAWLRDAHSFTNRYDAMGIDMPDPDTMCDGDCEGTGFVPISRDDQDPIYQALWQAAEAEEHDPDGWHFVQCPSCKGSGKRVEQPQLEIPEGQEVPFYGDPKRISSRSCRCGNPITPGRKQPFIDEKCDPCLHKTWQGMELREPAMASMDKEAAVTLKPEYIANRLIQLIGPDKIKELSLEDLQHEIFSWMAKNQLKYTKEDVRKVHDQISKSTGAVEPPPKEPSDKESKEQGQSTGPVLPPTPIEDITKQRAPGQPEQEGPEPVPGIEPDIKTPLSQPPVPFSQTIKTSLKQEDALKAWSSIVDGHPSWKTRFKGNDSFEWIAPMSDSKAVFKANVIAGLQLRPDDVKRVMAQRLDEQEALLSLAQEILGYSPAPNGQPFLTMSQADQLAEAYELRLPDKRLDSPHQLIDMMVSWNWVQPESEMHAHDKGTDTGPKPIPGQDAPSFQGRDKLEDPVEMGTSDVFQKRGPTMPSIPTNSNNQKSDLTKSAMTLAGDMIRMAMFNEDEIAETLMSELKINEDDALGIVDAALKANQEQWTCAGCGKDFSQRVPRVAIAGETYCRSCTKDASLKTAKYYPVDMKDLQPRIPCPEDKNGKHKMKKSGETEWFTEYKCSLCGMGMSIDKPQDKKAAVIDEWGDLIEMSKENPDLDKYVTMVAETLNGGFDQFLNNLGDEALSYLRASMQILQQVGTPEALQAIKIIQTVQRLARQHQRTDFTSDSASEALAIALDPPTDEFYTISDALEKQVWKQFKQQPADPAQPPLPGLETSLKKRANQDNKEDYIWYLSNTLIPDMKESGNVETAKDFQKIVSQLKSGRVDKGYIDWLLATLIPDLADSGKMATAEDLLEGIFWLTGEQHPLPQSENYDEEGFAKNPNVIKDEDASLKKQAGTLWSDIFMRDQVPAHGEYNVNMPQPGWRVKSDKFGIDAPVVSADEKFVQIKPSQRLPQEEFDQLAISDIQYTRGDHPKGVYSISADGFRQYPGRGAIWKLYDGSGKEILPKGAKPAVQEAPPEHEVEQQAEEPIQGLSSLKAAYESYVTSAKKEKKTWKPYHIWKKEKEEGKEKKSSWTKANFEAEHGIEQTPEQKQDEKRKTMEMQAKNPPPVKPDLRTQTVKERAQMALAKIKRDAKYFEVHRESDKAGSAWELDQKAKKLKRKKMQMKMSSTLDFFKNAGFKYKEGDKVFYSNGLNEVPAIVTRRLASKTIDDDKYYEVKPEGSNIIVTRVTETVLTKAMDGEF